MGGSLHQSPENIASRKTLPPNTPLSSRGRLGRHLTAQGVMAAPVCCSGWFGRPWLGQLLRAGRADVADHARLARPEPQVVGPRLAQTERPVRATAAPVRVAVILSIILPVADLADLEGGSLSERLASAARASERQLARPGVEPGGVLVEPRKAVGMLLGRRNIFRAFAHRCASEAERPAQPPGPTARDE